MITSIIALYLAVSAPKVSNVSIVVYSVESSEIKEQPAIQPLHEVYIARVTAYALTGTMASGKQVYFGAAACPRAIPLGTFVEIGTLGDFKCEDRTALKNDGTFDIWAGDYDSAIQFGVQHLSITIK